MSKEAALRAMREAKYNARAGATKQPATRARVPVAPPTKAATPTSEAGSAGDGLCGHRSINGRTCTREQGHAAKNHRYS